MHFRLTGWGGGARGASRDWVAVVGANLDLAVDGLTAEPADLAGTMLVAVVQLAKVNLILHALRARLAAGVPAQVKAADAELEKIFDQLGEAEMLAIELRRRFDQAMSAASAQHLSVATLGRDRRAGKPGRGWPGAT